MSVAILARLPQTRPRKLTASASPSRATCQGAGGAARLQLGGQAVQDGDALIAERGEGAGGAAELDALDAGAELVEAGDVVDRAASARPRISGRR